jgi:hypothetical protein
MSALRQKRTLIGPNEMAAKGHKQTSVHPMHDKNERGRKPKRPTSYSVRRAPPFRATSRFLRRPTERRDQSPFALVRRPLPPYGGTRVSETKGLLRAQRPRTKIDPAPFQNRMWRARLTGGHSNPELGASLRMPATWASGITISQANPSGFQS